MSVNVEIIDTTDLGSIYRKAIVFASERNDRVPAFLLIPKQAKKSPAMLCLHQTTPEGNKEPAGLAGKPNLYHALELATKLNPKHYRPHSYLGCAYALAHNTKAGCDSMFQAIIIHPSSQDGQRMALSKWNAYRGHLPDAIRDYERILAANPTNIEAINNLGILLAFRNQREEAILKFRSATTLDPSNIEANNNLGVLWMHRGKMQRAIQYFEKAHQYSPKNAQINYNLGLAHHRKSDYRRAEAYYEEALRLDPTIASATAQSKEAKAGRPPIDPETERTQEISSVSGIWPIAGLLGTTFIPDLTLAQRQLEYGLRLQRQGLNDLAIQQYSNAMRLNPYLPDSHLNLGTIFYQKHQLQRSYNHYAASLNLKPNNPVAYNGIGTILVNARKVNEAIRHFERTLTLAPNYTLARRNLAHALHFSDRFYLIPVTDAAHLKIEVLRTNS